MTERTLADLLALPAGKELDGMLAELCGEEVNWDTGQPSVWRSGLWLEPLRRSQLIGCAWPLLAEMLAAGATITLAVWDGRMQLDYDFVSSGDLVNVPTLDAAPLAIVRAWATWVYGKGDA